MKRSEAFPSTYLSKDDVDPPITATINDVYHVNLKGDAGDETKTAMSFVEPDVKPMIVNNANWMTCEDLYGEDSDGWAGHKVEIFKDPTIMFGGKRVGGGRVRDVRHPGGNSASAHQGVFAEQRLYRLRRQPRQRRGVSID